MNVNEIVADVASQNVQHINITPDGLIPKEYEVPIYIGDLVKHMQFDEKSMITLFLRSAINLKTEINREVEKHRCAETGEPFRAKNVPVGRINPQAFAIIGALTAYIRMLSSKFWPDMHNYIESYIMDHKDELIFTGLNVRFDTDTEAAKMNGIVDALCVKFYDNLLYAITVFLSIKGKAFISNVDGGTYIFKFRDFNIMEKDAVSKGHIPFNLRE